MRITALRTLLIGTLGMAWSCGGSDSQRAAQWDTETPLPTPAAAPRGLVDQEVPRADDDMASVLSELAGLNGRPIETLTAVEARNQPGPADALRSLLERQGRSTDPVGVAKVENRTYESDGGALPVRIYTPDVQSIDLLPVVLYFHGGGLVLGDIDAYDATPRGLANGARAIVVSAEYRKAPEHKFPAAHEDAFAAYQWVLANAVTFGGDPSRVAVAGESAGGNLAANVSILARDRDLPLPRHQLLVYPMTTTAMDTPSYSRFANAKPLNRAMMGWFFDKIASTPADLQDPRLNLIEADLGGLPPTTIVLAELDPLRSDGDLLAQRMRARNVRVDTRVYPGAAHEFFGMGAAVEDARSAVTWASVRLLSAFGTLGSDETP